MMNLKQRIASFAREIGVFHKDLAALRGSLAQLKAERDAIVGAPLPLAEALVAAETAIRRGAGCTEADWFVDSVLSGNPTQVTPQTLDGLLVEAAVAGAAALMERRLRETPPGLPAAERASALAALDTKILRLEHDEEAAIRDLEHAGFAVERRPDADPAAVLGL